MHPGRVLRLLPLILAIGPASVGSSQSYNEADYVRNLFRKYVNREPTSNEVAQWAWKLNKGETSEALQVALLSSDAYYGRYQRDPNAFFTGLFADVLSRTPTLSESTQWVRYFNQIGGDRKRVVQAFLKAAAQELTAQKPVFELPKSGSVDQLVATAQLLSGALQTELGGISQGRHAIVMGRNLLAVTQTLQRASSNGATPNRQIYQDVRVALNALENEMRWNNLSASTSSWYLSRFTIQLDKLDTSESALVPLPGAPSSPTTGPVGDNQLITTSVALLRDTQQVIFSVRSITNRTESDNQLLRDLEFFSSQVDAFQHTLYGGGTMQSLRSLFVQLRTRADGVSRSLRFGNPAGYIVQDWRRVAQDLGELGRLLGVSQGAMIDPGYPVLFNSPTFYHLPYQLQYATSSTAGAETRALIDRTIAQIDAFTAGFTPLLPYLIQAPEIQAAALDLRKALSEMRQNISWNSPPDKLKQLMDQINTTSLRLTANWRQVVRGSQFKNIPSMNDISTSIQQLNQLYRNGTLLTRSDHQRTPDTYLFLARAKY